MTQSKDNNPQTHSSTPLGDATTDSDFVPDTTRIAEFVSGNKSYESNEPIELTDEERELLGLDD